MLVGVGHVIVCPKSPCSNATNVGRYLAMVSAMTSFTKSGISSFMWAIIPDRYRLVNLRLCANTETNAPTVHSLGCCLHTHSSRITLLFNHSGYLMIAISYLLALLIKAIIPDAANSRSVIRPRRPKLSQLSARFYPYPRLAARCTLSVHRKRGVYAFRTVYGKCTLTLRKPPDLRNVLPAPR
jgi:hypothetical protein